MTASRQRQLGQPLRDCTTARRRPRGMGAAGSAASSRRDRPNRRKRSAGRMRWQSTYRDPWGAVLVRGTGSMWVTWLVILRVTTPGSTQIRKPAEVPTRHSTTWCRVRSCQSRRSVPVPGCRRRVRWSRSISYRLPVSVVISQIPPAVSSIEAVTVPAPWWPCLPISALPSRCWGRSGRRPAPPPRRWSSSAA